MNIVTIDAEITMELLTPFDAEEIFLLTEANRSFLGKYLPWVDGTKTAEDTRGFIKSCLIALAEMKDLAYAIRHKRNIIGIVDVFSTNDSTGTFEIGYWLAENFTGKGIMTSCVKSLIGIAFDKLGAEKIEIFCSTANPASNRIPQKLGMVPEGTIRHAEKIGDTINDLNVYGILKSERRDII